MEPEVYEISPERVPEIFERLDGYGVTGVDVENTASLFDDMLESGEEKLRYARERLANGNIDKALLVVRNGVGTLVVKMENVVEIRVTLRDYKRLLEEFELER